MADERQRDIEARFKALEEQNAKLMAELEAKVEQAGGGISGEVLEQILTRSSEAAAKAAAGPSQVLAAKLKPENADHLHMGPFEHPLGGIQMPKPPLARECWFAGQQLRHNEITYVEAVALNALSASLSRAQRRIARDGKWSARVSDDDQRLYISVPMKTIDDRAELPSFLEITQELTTGERALDQAELAAEVALLRSEVQRMKATTTA